MIPIKNFENYSITESGEVFGPKGKIKAHNCGVGYLKVVLWKKGKIKNKRIHRLVAEHYLLDFKPELQVNHIDGNKHNNHYTNLEMVTAKQNIRHAAQNGKHNYKKKPLLTKEEVAKIWEYFKEGVSSREIAILLGRSQRCIQHVRSRKIRKNYAKTTT